MAKLSSILQERFRKKEKPKMSELGAQTSQGNLTVFSGLFGMPSSGEKEKKELAEILSKYASDDAIDISYDLSSLLAITEEVKAINNQATLLHGERIKKAQEILKKYREGAFTAWLHAAYGNRQTPYNFLQYYEFYSKMPKSLHPQMEAMPRQAVYTLASRVGEFSKKEEIVRNYKGETKQQMITLIRSFFPLKEGDKRGENIVENSIKQLERLNTTFRHAQPKISAKHKQRLLELLELLKSYL
jgi:Uncharacterised protein family (UPF0137)